MAEAGKLSVISSTPPPTPPEILSTTPPAATTVKTTVPLTTTTTPTITIRTNTTPTTTTTATTTTTTTITTQPPNATVVIENTTLIENTSGTAPLSPSASVIVIAITVSVIVCIVLIIAFCFLIYKRGEKKQKLKKSLVLEAAFTPKNKRTKESKSEVDPRLSTILETGQSHDEAINNSQSGSTERYIPTTKDPSGVRESNGRNSENNAEPQYANLMSSRQQKQHEEAAYIDPNVHDMNSKNGEHTQLAAKTSDADRTDSFYENFAASPSYSNVGTDDGNAIYQNTEQLGPHESFYEEPIQKNSEVYVDMA